MEEHNTSFHEKKRWEKLKRQLSWWIKKVRKAGNVSIIYIANPVMSINDWQSWYFNTKSGFIRVSPTDKRIKMQY